ncbi:hypothetical protein [Streptomyces malaysiensis]|uniref:hypothetical protein n=1 Tax=Streptomyces malaysiensis TaxID=92644 RepID=UPI000852C4BC|nr:hypothetical protein [Streptomyces sp. SPMA113]
MRKSDRNSQIQYGDVTGDVGTVIQGATGPVALNGNVYINSTDDRDERDATDLKQGAVVIEGDNYGGIHRNF